MSKRIYYMDPRYCEDCAHFDWNHRRPEGDKGSRPEFCHRGHRPKFAEPDFDLKPGQRGYTPFELQEWGWRKRCEDFVTAVVEKERKP